jgi:tRNA wybutosine-synthesizing protein 4
VCGGVGQDPSSQGQSVACLVIKDKSLEVHLVDLGEKAGQLPFMVGSATVSSGSQLVIVGGGATCFSMGTFWDTGVYRVDLADVVSKMISGRSIHNEPVVVSYQNSPKLTQPTADGGQPKPQPNACITTIPKIKLQSKSDFEKLVQGRKPVIIEGLDLGGCVEKWSPEYMAQSVGETKEAS